MLIVLNNWWQKRGKLKISVSNMEVCNKRIDFVLNIYNSSAINKALRNYKSRIL